MFKRLSLLFIIALAFTNPIAAAEPKVVKLAEGVYGFIGKEGATNSGFVVTNEGVVVIDTQGPKELALLLKKKIHEITDKPVVYVINTHFHGDHIFGNQYFKKAREIISHENTNRNLIEKDKQHREQFKKFFGENSLEGFELTLPTKTIKDTLTLRVGNKTMEIAYLGKGHTDGDIIVFLSNRRYRHLRARGVCCYRGGLHRTKPALWADIQLYLHLYALCRDMRFPWSCYLPAG